MPKNNIYITCPDDVPKKLPIGDTIVLIGPTGVGKTTIIKAFIRKNQQTQTLQSYTDRPKRKLEENKLCISPQEFDQKLKNDDFFDVSELYGCRVANSRHQISKLDPKSPLIFDYPFQHLYKIPDMFPKRTIIYIALLPPSHEELKKRLFQRPERYLEGIKDLEAILAQSQANQIDVTMINNDLQMCLVTLERVLKIS